MTEQTWIGNEDRKINHILNSCTPNIQINDLDYSLEIIDLMRNYRDQLPTDSTANILFLLNSLHQSRAMLTEFKQYHELSDIEKQILQEILSHSI